MIRSDRRTLMKGSMALAALGAFPAALRAEGSRPAIFIYDARFAASRELAEGWREQGVPTIDPRVQDLGVAWRETIPALLAEGGGIAGATMWSDRFICETFARDYGLSLQPHDARLPGTSDASLRAWVIA